MAKIGFIGLGNMGGPMAENLLKAGHDVTVFDLNTEAVKNLEGLGARSASNLQTLAQDKEFIVTMLPASQHVKNVYLSDEGLIHTLSAECVVIDSSTIDAATAKLVAQQLGERGVQFVDAPVSGGVGGAKAGTLTFIVGGEQKTFSAVEPILSAMGKNIFHAGDHGAGQVAKICNNMLLSILMVGTSEALQMAIDNGLDPKVMSDIMLKSSGRNWTLELYNPCPGVMDNVPSSNQYQGGFMVDLMKKDLGLAMETATHSSSSTPMGALAQSLYTLHSQHGYGKQDFSSIFTMFENKK
ncbi:3-hydroxyisobutyrate dehydrogenase [Aestuariibacter sp. AA17]|uniref:3-hydroxyisobutyrate dehydrogenase n=1 Tax=Fluctibacter corallii TaxID=2984329 RepID=A0ABT3A980_9ALTE|nr:3-hydroxyisobutyrate dehydrogenase [Aestuariibacter sp. AA17]MCV2885237.1 3-hydroxyisobutyrate dehydrogenase [Aestuariibacter sp. AA17]